MKRPAESRVAVIGGAGFIGSHVVDRLLERHAKAVVIVDNLFLGRVANITDALKYKDRVTFYQEDASCYQRMQAILERHQTEVVFNLAVIPLPTSLERPKWTVDTNLTTVSTLCELARAGFYKSLIHVSSSEAYGTAQYVPMDEAHPLNPATPYAASKAAADHVVLSYAQTFGLDCSIVRPFNNYGPRQNDGSYAGIIPRVIRRVLRGEPPEIFGDGEQTRDFIFVKDTAAAIVRSYEIKESRGKILNLASGREVTVNALMEMLIRILHGDPARVIHTEPRPGDIRRHCGNVNLAREILEFEPTTSLEEGLHETSVWYKRNSEPRNTRELM